MPGTMLALCCGLVRERGTVQTSAIRPPRPWSEDAVRQMSDRVDGMTGAHGPPSKTLREGCVRRHPPSTEPRRTSSETSCNGPAECGTIRFRSLFPLLQKFLLARLDPT